MSVTIQDSFSRQEPVLETLLTLLGKERIELCQSHPDGEALGRIAELKLVCFETLQNDEFLGEELAASGKEKLPASTATARNRFLDKLREIRRLNTLNGQLLQSRMIWNTRVLNFLRESQDGSTYNPAGKSERQRSRIESHA